MEDRHYELLGGNPGCPASGGCRDANSQRSDSGAAAPWSALMFRERLIAPDSGIDSLPTLPEKSFISVRVE